MKVFIVKTKRPVWGQPDENGYYSDEFYDRPAAERASARESDSYVVESIKEEVKE